MRKIVLMCLTTLFFGQVLLLFGSQEGKAIGKITFPLNRVFVIPAGTNNLNYARFNMEVFAGDKIETKKESRCEITLKNGDILRIDENSIFTLENIRIGDNSVQGESFLGIGKLWANIKKIFSDDDYFKVKSPSAVIAVRGTIYRVNANQDTTTEVRVYDGEVSVSPPEQGGAQAPKQEQQPRLQQPQQIAPPQEKPGPTEVSVSTWLAIVKAQQQIVVKPDGKYEQSEFDAESDAQMDWVQWNMKRDSLLGRGR